MSERVYIALGANLGNRAANMRMALRLLSPVCRLDVVSSLYESPALVPEGERPGSDFYNAVCAGETDLDAPGLLAHLKQIEHEIGRRPAPQWSARPIDLDLLLYGDTSIDIEAISVPHPRMCDRAFVLVPLAEIAPSIVHPARRQRIDELAAGVDRQGLRVIAGPVWARDSV